ncbi:Spermidine/putrescine import ATP-binding protein PotA [Castellaniella defragrans]
MSAIQIRNISRRFGDYLALAHVDLEVREGEFFSLLGPSGCGKTTLLNIIAGFLDPNSGELKVGGEDITAMPPYLRNIGMVFQNYALFPHMSVAENIAYGLKIRKLDGGEIKKRVSDVLAQVRLADFGKRMPHQLSGGQQQRVAIARALAIRPRVLLLDEPLSNLDAKLRKEMQGELRTLQKKVGITTILVTHNQEEALSLSDRIGVLGRGVLQQVGTPHELYHHPINRFVAEFIGQANLIRVAAGAGTHQYRALEHRTQAGELLLAQPSAPADTPMFLLRPEAILAERANGDEPSGPNHARVTLQGVTYTGATVRLVGSLAGGGQLTAHVAEALLKQIPEMGAQFDFQWSGEDLVGLADSPSHPPA